MSEEFEHALSELERNELADILLLLHRAGGASDAVIEILTLYQNLSSEGRQRVREFVDDLTDWPLGLLVITAAVVASSEAVSMSREILSGDGRVWWYTKPNYRLPKPNYFLLLLLPNSEAGTEYPRNHVGKAR